MKIIFAKPDMEFLKNLADEMADDLEGLEVSFSSSRYLELNKKGVSKGEALKQLAKITGIALNETLAIGDNFNDLSMFEAAGKAAAVANASMDVIEHCDYVSKADHNEGGVGEIIEEMVLKPIQSD